MNFSQHTRSDKRFKRVALWTLVSVFLVILAGGIVRSTGSGMGCPDWPKCFGQWVPPTSEAQLPSDYQETYSEKRKKKNERTAKVLNTLGFSELSHKILNDPSIYEEEPFNVVKTYIEYINRLAGVIAGLLMFWMLALSFLRRKRDKATLFLCLTTFVLTGFQGWFGSLVVSVNLMPWAVTVHMLTALVIIGLLIIINFRVGRKLGREENVGKRKILSILTLVALPLTGIQVFLGTKVRSAVDLINGASFHPEEIESFATHRSFSIVVFLLNLIIFYIIMKNNSRQSRIVRAGLAMVTVLIAEIILGTVTAYFNLPPWSQPLHLLFASFLFGLQLYLLLLTGSSKEGLKVVSFTNKVN